MAETKKIFILGGGYGGVWAGKMLGKRYKKNPNVEITLVDRRPFHTLMTELCEVAGWRTDPNSITVPFERIFSPKHKVRFMQDDITDIDFEAKTAKGKKRSYDFDYIIMGTGAEPEYFGIPGIEENSFTMWSYEDALEVRYHLEDVFYKAAIETDPAKRRSLLTFVVAGAGFTGIEMLGEILEYREDMCKKYHIPPEDVRLLNIEALPAILPILDEPLRVKAEKYLKKHGCEILLNAPITGAEPGKVFLKDGTVIETDTFIWTCGVKSGDFNTRLGLTQGERGRGRIQTDAQMRSVDYPFVYIVGDNVFFKENGKPVPQVVETAHQTAEIAAKNIIAEIENQKERHSLKLNLHGFMISIGGRYGVANAGGIKTTGMFAMAMKHLINTWYLFNIAGIPQAWEYLRHEFFDMERRSMVGGFVGWRIRSFWALPLRLWLGIMWIFEGINKIGEGWLKWSLGSKSSWMFSPGMSQATLAKAGDAVQTVSAATDAVAEVVTAASDVVGTAQQAAEALTAATDAIVETVSTASDAAVSTGVSALGKVWDLSKPIFNPNGVVATWFRTVFMDGIFRHMPFEIFQLMIVVVEIAIGLAIFGGTFTWLAGLVSIGMCLIFTLSGMFAWSQLWFVFAGVLMLGGLGRSFGLDYWIVPFCKDRYTRFSRNRMAKWRIKKDLP